MRRKRAPVTRVGKNADTFTGFTGPTSPGGDGDQPVPSNKLQALDASFFDAGSTLSARPFVQGSARHGQEFSRGMTYPHQNVLNDDGTRVEGRKARMAAVSAANGEAVGAKGKKHFKGNRKVKQRSGKGYD